MTKLTIKTIRAAVKQLRSRAVMPNRKGNYTGYSPVQLIDGVVHFGCVAAMHPASFLDMFGEKKFRALRSDVSKAKMDKFIRTWKAMKVIRGKLEV